MLNGPDGQHFSGHIHDPQPWFSANRCPVRNGNVRVENVDTGNGLSRLSGKPNIVEGEKSQERAAVSALSVAVLTVRNGGHSGFPES
ncbi:hypothetical protein D3C78_1243610 [compost metagenome]